MVLWIACEIEKEGGSFLVRAHTIWTELPKIKVWTEMKRISFMENTIQNLSEIPTCPRLQTLLLRRNLIDTVSNSFFQYMPCLKVLDLSYNHFKELPPGISRLVSLEYLNLSNTAMRELPEELKALVNLKYLNLEYVFRIRILPSKLISSFSNLQVLRMLQCIFLNPENVSQLLIEELLSLKKLTVLNIKSSHALEMFIKSNVLKSCTHSLCLREFEDLKSLEVSFLAKMKHLDVLYILFCKQLEELKIKSTRVRMPVRKTDYFKNLHELFISSCSNLRDLTGLILAPHLKFIRASRCSSIEEIINEEKLCEVLDLEGSELMLLGNLRRLWLDSLRNLKSICRNILPAPYLKEMRVIKCPKLKRLPFNSNRASERKIIIKAHEEWWNILHWEDQSDQSAFEVEYQQPL